VSADRPRILVEPNAHHLLNLGDVAMLQIALERFAELWPEAEVQVITDDPARLRVVAPRARPVPAGGRRLWFEDAYLTHTFHRVVAPRASEHARELEARFRRRWPGGAERLVRARAAIRRDDTGPLDDFLLALERADVVVSTGAGAITDVFKPLALSILDLLATAKSRGATTAILGHGIGPIANPALLERARSVLPTLDLLTLREGELGPPLLAELGVDEGRVHVTGDDAIELAFRDPSAAAHGSGIGFNVRVARYSGAARTALVDVAEGVRAAAAALGAPVVPIPISWYPGEADAEHIAALLDHDAPASTPALPRDVIASIGDCRAVVTSSYHAAVFALAQGRTAVCLTGSSYYDAKFLGLAALFDGGVTIVPLREEARASRVAAAIEAAVATADEQRPRLRTLATRQIEAGRAAYRLLGEIVAGTADGG
jgi:polysaccharide pyruvyl transferase WcaK-like protein